MSKAPDGLAAGGRSLWKSVTKAHTLDGPQRVQLAEACRIKDRCDDLDGTVRRLRDEGELKDYLAALSKANEAANQMKQLLAALRLPDEATGKKPQRRGPRGAQKPTVPGGANVSTMDRARQAKSA